VSFALIFDWETTGLPLHPDAPLRKQPRVIEFGGVLVDSARKAIVSEHSWLVNPGVPLEPIITKITGLTDADLADAPPFAELLPRVRDLFGRASVMVAHNLPFDHFLLQLELQRLNAEADFPWPAGALCTVQTYRPEWGKRPTLKELYAHVTGQPLAQTHRALDDCKALAEIVLKENLLDLFNIPATAGQD